MRTTIFALTSLFAAAACGGTNALDPGAGNSLGSGTSTLSVEGSISADTELSNPGDALSFTTHFDVQLRKDQLPITTGTVTVSSNGGDVALVFNAADNGHWTGDQAGYHEVYELNVTSGTDTITGVRVDGPDIHTFTAPGLGATVDTTMPIPVSWSRHDHADATTIDTHNLDKVTIDDSGSYSLAAGAMQSSKDKAQPGTITIRRTNQVAPAGAVVGSTVSVSVRNHVDVVVAINPNA